VDEDEAMLAVAKTRIGRRFAGLHAASSAWTCRRATPSPHRWRCTTCRRRARRVRLLRRIHEALAPRRRVHQRGLLPSRPSAALRAPSAGDWLAHLGRHNNPASGGRLPARLGESRSLPRLNLMKAAWWKPPDSPSTSPGAADRSRLVGLRD
jgi:hypothetical protein